MLEVLTSGACLISVLCQPIWLECCRGLVDSPTMFSERCITFKQVSNALDSVLGVDIVYNVPTVAHASSLQPASSALCCPLDPLGMTSLPQCLAMPRQQIKH